MGKKLEGKRVAFLVTDGFEQEELTGPKRALEDEGARCDIVSPKDGKVKGWKHVKWGDEFEVDQPLGQAKPDDFDSLVLPGGQINPDVLRADKDVQRFVRAFFDAGKPVGAICHGPWILIDAGVVEGKRVTSWESIRTDLRNAGADVVDEECVVDDGLVTSRKPDDIPAFSRKLVEEIAEGSHGHGHARPRADAAAPPR
ncbi:MAG: type 1 glutamine amidotransferase [Labilithrix sp.]|nr:type 1 glutamine amidotransferase [Labilithrix sp.]MBX3216427.1 type 1 glutamine amidotransferase [Labilithrix sp.]